MADENKTKENDDNVERDDEVVDDANTTEESENKPEEKTFTQSELDSIIADRLARADKKRDEAIQKERDEAEKQKLEEQSEYKELYEKAQADIETAKADALNVKKDSLLYNAGYDERQIETLRDSLKGEDLEAEVEALKEVFSPKKDYIHQSPMGAGKKPTPSDEEDVGRDAVRNILHKLKL